MADITLYSPSGKSITVDGSDYKKAVAKGWSRTKPSASATPSMPDAQSKPPAGPVTMGQERPGFSGTMPPPSQQEELQKSMKDTTFMQGLGRGINPFHSAPEGLPKGEGVMGGIGAAAMDMGNLREMQALEKAGNRPGRAGMQLGTTLQFAGPEIVKGMIGANRTIRGIEGASQAARAAERATSLQKELKGPIKYARMAADYTQPLVDHLSRQYDKLHTLLDKEALPFDSRMVQLARKMEMASEPVIDKLGTDILTKLRTQGGSQTLMEYGAAHGLHRQIQRMLGRLDVYKIGQWAADLGELDNLMEKGKAAVAQSKGLGAEWEALGKMWGQTNDLTKAIMTRMSNPQGLIGKGLEKLGVEQGLPRGATSVGRELAGKAGVDATKMPKPGGGMAKAGLTGMQALGPLLRALMSTMQQPSRPPM